MCFYWECREDTISQHEYCIAQFQTALKRSSFILYRRTGWGQISGHSSELSCYSAFPTWSKRDRFNTASFLPTPWKLPNREEAPWTWLRLNARKLPVVDLLYKQKIICFSSFHLYVSFEDYHARSPWTASHSNTRTPLATAPPTMGAFGQPFLAPAKWPRRSMLALMPSTEVSNRSLRFWPGS